MNLNMQHNVAITPKSGEYQYRANVGTGTITMEIGDGDGNFQDMIEGTFSADSDGTMVLSMMPIRVQLTGTATMRLSPVRNY